MTTDELREAVAKKIEPQAWAALSVGDTLAYKNRRTSSLRKADIILSHEPIAEALALKQESDRLKQSTGDPS